MDRKSKVAVTLSIAGLCILLMLAAVINGCGFLPLSLFPDKDAPGGSLLLHVNENMQPMIVLPDQNNTTAHYLVQIQHATSGADPIVQDVGAPPPVEGVVFPNLPSGLYNVQILGLCSPEEEVITDAFDTVLIAVNDETTVTLQMEIVDGTGDIAIDLEIDPFDLVPFDTIVGEFYKDDVWTEQVWTQASQGMWGYGRTEAPGYYIHKWQLWSMGAEPLGPLTGAAEALYLRNNRTSACTYFLDENNIVMPDEGAALIIIWEVEQPIQTFFVDSVSTVYLGEPYLLQTTSDADPLDVHSWYENGELLVGEDTPDYAGVAPLEPGFINYSKIGQKGGICTSAQKLVVFAEAPQVLTSVDWTPSGDVFIPGNTSAYPVAADVFNGGSLPIVDGIVIHWQFDPTSNPDALLACSLSSSSTVVSGGTVSNVINNSQNLMPNDFPIRVQVSIDQATWFTSPTITYGNY